MTARARLVDEVRAAGAQDAVAEVVERWPRDPQLAEALGGVTNPLPLHTVGLHVIGGDLAAAGASEWDPQTYAERPYPFEAEEARKVAWKATLGVEGGGA